MAKAIAPKTIPADQALFEDLPGDNWVVVRRALTRAQANTLREKLWAAGIVGQPTREFSFEQHQVWEEDWAQRIVLQVRAWSVCEEEGDGTTPIEMTRDGVDHLPDDFYQELTKRLSDLMKPRAAEDAKSGPNPGGPVVPGAANAPVDAPAQPAALREGDHVGAKVSAPVA